MPPLPHRHGKEIFWSRWCQVAIRSLLAASLLTERRPSARELRVLSGWSPQSTSLSSGRTTAFCKLVVLRRSKAATTRADNAFLTVPRKHLGNRRSPPVPDHAFALFEHLLVVIRRQVGIGRHEGRRLDAASDQPSAGLRHQCHGDRDRCNRGSRCELLPGSLDTDQRVFRRHAVVNRDGGDVGQLLAARMCGLRLAILMEETETTVRPFLPASMAISTGAAFRPP